MNIDRALNAVASKVTGWVEGFIRMLPNLAVAVVVVVIAWVMARLLARLLLRALDRVSHNRQINGLLATVLRVSIVVTGIFVALGLLELDKTVTSLLAGVGIVGLALGFAFQDIAANFMAGIIMAIRHPFREGDIVETKGYSGVVAKVDLRATIVRQFTGEAVIIPNKEVFQNPLINLSRGGTRRVDITVGVSYGDDLPEAAELARKAVEGIPDRDSDREVEVFYKGFGASSIDLDVYFWIPYSSQIQYLRARSEAVVRIKAAFDAAGVTIPFPIRTLDFSNVGGQQLDAMLPKSKAAQ